MMMTMAFVSQSLCAFVPEEIADQQIQALHDALRSKVVDGNWQSLTSIADCDWSSVRLHITDHAQEHDDIFLQWVSQNPAALRSFCCLSPDEPHCWKTPNATHTRCCYPNLAALLRNPPEWVVAEVEQQRYELNSIGWGPGSISRMHLNRFADRLIELPPFRENEGPLGSRLCRFQVVAGIISACNVGTTMTGHDDALLNALKILQQFVQLPDLDFFVSTTDVEHNAWEIPVFTKQRPAGMDGAGLLLIPHEFLLTTWNRKMELIADRSAHLWPWANKMSKLFWRGGGTAQWMCETPEGTNCTPIKFNGLSLETLALCPRGRLVLLSSLSPMEVDAKFSNIFDGKLQHIARRWGWLDDENRPAHEEFFAYKYGWNDEHSDAVFWRLRGNSLQFITMGRYTHWLLPHGVTLRPFEHFLPVRHDQSNLLEQLKWAQEHDDDARRIAEAGANLTAQMLDPEAGPLVYLYVLLTMYAELQSP